MSCPIFKSPGGTPTKTPQRRMKDALPAFLTIQLLLLTPTGCWGRPPALGLAWGKGQVSDLSTEGPPTSAWWVSWKDQITIVQPQKLPLVAQSKQAPRSPWGLFWGFPILWGRQPAALLVLCAGLPTCGKGDLPSLVMKLPGPLQVVCQEENGRLAASPFRH